MKLPRNVTIIEVKQKGQTYCIIQSNDLFGENEWRAFAADLDDYLTIVMCNEIHTDIRRHSIKVWVSRGKSYNILTDAMQALQIRVTRS